MLPAGDPAGIAHYAHESAYRCLVDMDKATEVLGGFSKQLSVWVGRGTQVVTYPVAQHRFLNVAAFVRDHAAWPDKTKQTALSSKKEIREAFSTFGPTLRRLMDILPDEQNRWGIFDTFDHPLPSFAYGSVALAGDAAHGSTPHHGSGAGMGVEDALVLSVVLGRAMEMLGQDKSFEKTEVVSAAFKAYDSVRRERSQWLVWSSRRQGGLAKAEIPECRHDREKFTQDCNERLKKLLHHEWKPMVDQALENLEQYIHS